MQVPCTNLPRKLTFLRRSLVNIRMRAVAFAWSLALVCYVHHLGHFLHALGLHEHAHTGFMAALGSPIVSGALGAAALLGPGRPLLVDGALSLARGNPNMNSLIALGATTSFAAGSLSALLPGYTVDPSFLEEPVMLLAFVLLGRSLEARARVQASADLTALAQLIPSEARMVLDPGAKPGAASAAGAATGEELLMIATATVRRGDLLRVLPGEKVPVDGQVVDGSCVVDESMLTGESRLKALTTGDLVTGGTIAYEAPFTMAATATGASSTLACIGRLVADAQQREAPVQRLADVVAGYFCFSVMAASAGTFAFWSTIGESKDGIAGLFAHDGRTESDCSLHPVRHAKAPRGSPALWMQWVTGWMPARWC
jgi:P-type Cu+ transporter